jgi:energy-coupling factor transporter ATP-binding protein EcfA2
MFPIGGTKGGFRVSLTRAGDQIKFAPSTAVLYERGSWEEFGVMRNSATGTILVSGHWRKTESCVMLQEDPDLLYIDARFWLKDQLRCCTLEAGWIWLHAAAVTGQGKAYLIVGPKGSGKTTTLLNLCLNHGMSMVSNDITMLQINRGRITAFSWPSTMRLTLDNWVRCCAKAIQSYDWTPVLRTPTQKIEFETQEVARMLSIGVAARCEPHVMYILDPPLGDRCLPLQPEEAAALIARYAVRTPLKVTNLQGRCLPSLAEYDRRVRMIGHHVGGSIVALRCGRDYVSRLGRE